MPDRTPEQQALYDELDLLGIALPLRTAGYAGAGLAHADGKPLYAGLASGSLTFDRLRAAAIARIVNRATGTPDHEAGPFPVLLPLTPTLREAASNPLDPDHLVARACVARRDAAE